MNYNYKTRPAAPAPAPVQQAPVGPTPPVHSTTPSPPTPPAAYTQQQRQQQTVGGIRRCDARNKVLSFHPKLSLPDEKNYPALQRGYSSEKESGPTSCIALNLTDYSGKAKGAGSVYATINLPIDDFFYWREIVEVKMASATAELPVLAALQGQLQGVMNDFRTNSQALNQVGSEIRAVAPEQDAPYLVHLREVAKGNKRIEQTLTQCGESLSSVTSRLGANAETVLRREIINPYGEQDSAGRYPVRKLTVTYQPVYNGKVSNYPWCVIIANGYGIMEKDDIGRTVCKRGSYQETAKASINIDTKQLYCALRGVCSFIETWENCVAGPMVLNMESRRNNARRNGNG